MPWTVHPGQPGLCKRVRGLFLPVNFSLSSSNFLVAEWHCVGLFIARHWRGCGLATVFGCMQSVRPHEGRGLLEKVNGTGGSGADRQR
ncbi:hypothetical protein AVEN_75398-1 [Araneus ventricosus]|uniref:Uncharacterized protein n=1 Tax=Araneus ventricosus TaxID=182803 RepID=A0A4Y2WPG9_ARAVE|nr:hypothetical protein AVEN_75398-1 [Araneus ventricosus]